MEENMNTHQLLRDAALKGDVTILRFLVAQDPFLLHTSSKIKPLHISSKLGHLEFTAELLRLNPSLAKELDPTDKSSPLHLASGNGHVDVVKALAATNPCLCLARDMHGMNPAHVAAVKGHVLVLEELIRAVPAAARERVGGGRESILHLCVKYNQLEALKAVVEMAAGDAGLLLNAKDGDGNTILHIAMADERVEIIRFLLSDDRVEQNMQNEFGWTVKDILKQNKKNAKTKNTQMSVTVNHAKAKLLSSKEIKKRKKKRKLTSWFNDQRSALMVVASLVATMAFQAGITPPFSSSMGSTFDTSSYEEFVIANTIGLLTSMSSIMLLISGLPGRRFFVVLVMVLMWVAVSCMIFICGISLGENIGEMVHAFNSTSNSTSDQHFFNKDENLFLGDLGIGVSVWVLVTALTLIWHVAAWTLRVLIRCFRWLGKMIPRCMYCFKK